MKKFLLSLVSLLIIFQSQVNADEGMWIPLLIEKYNIQDMQAKGFKLDAEDIYSINQACIKDAIVIFGRGCTGELVSDQGLLLTNHHCGFEAIQKHSSVEHDYLKDGFWAMNKDQELPNPDLTVRFLNSIEDVTDAVLNGVKKGISEQERESIIELNIEKIKTESVKDTTLIASIKPFYYGNQYFLFVYQEYKDVRLVGAPPSSIGKFGGDTDNWMWPRHTGDFSIFRIYADKNNNPAEYSPENVPYRPKKFLPISIKGINEGDFTWVIGYPGGTTQYITSDAIRLIKNVRNPNRIKLRDKRLEIMNRYMENNDTIRIKYASKNAGVSNSWKRWKGEIIGLNRLDVINKKIELENKFNTWANQNNRTEYIGVLDELSDIYSSIEEYAIAYDYWRESILGIEIIDFVSDFDKIIKLAKSDIKSDEFLEERDELIKNAEKFFKDYEQSIDKETFKALIPLYYEDVNGKYHPNIENLDLNKSLNDYTDNLYEITIFTKKDKLIQLLSEGSKEEIAQLASDPVYGFYKEFSNIYNNLVYPVYDSLQTKSEKLYRSYMRGLQEMNPDKVYYPDANFTMRVSYGNVEGFTPRDAVEYNYYTTLDGVIEKDNPEIYDYDVPDQLKKVYNEKNFGRYAVNGTVPVCFIATNHTTGGNSGSPVLDAEGNLIGLNFDRAWDGIMSDMMFDPERSRNVTIDIRYLLFIVDKFAGARNLINEMTIIE
jgi:hypothetical protein